jgi:hypothetical protein
MLTSFKPDLNRSPINPRCHLLVVPGIAIQGMKHPNLFQVTPTDTHLLRQEPSTENGSFLVFDF